MKEITNEEKKLIILDIMTDIDEFCRENNIPYAISSGTLLGAVRHGGFIPWDDDADMFMLREDFERFLDIYKDRKYHALYHTDNEKEFMKLGYAKVCDPTTYLDDPKSITRFGVYVDIFPLDSVPEDKKERDKYMDKVQKIQKGLRHRQKTDFISILISYFHSTEKWWNKLDEAIRNSGYKDSPLVAHIVGARNKRTVFNKNRFENLSPIEFEGRVFRTFKDTDEYLSMVYGDYMTPPPPDQRRGHAREKFYRY